MTATLTVPITSAEVFAETPCECRGDHHDSQPCPHGATWMARLHHVHDQSCPDVFALCDDCLAFAKEQCRQLLRFRARCTTCNTTPTLITDLMTVVPLSREPHQ